MKNPPLKGSSQKLGRTGAEVKATPQGHANL